MPICLHDIFTPVRLIRSFYCQRTGNHEHYSESDMQFHGSATDGDREAISVVQVEIFMLLKQTPDSQQAYLN